MRTKLVLFYTVLFSLLLTGCSSYYRQPYKIPVANVTEIRYDSLNTEFNDTFILPSDSIEQIVVFFNTFVGQLELGMPPGQPEAFLRFLQNDGRVVSVGRSNVNIYHVCYSSNAGNWHYTLESEEWESFFLSLPDTVL